MWNRAILSLALCAVASHASEELDSDKPAIAALIADLGSGDPAKQAAAHEELRAQRRAALIELVGRLERASDAALKQRLLEILKPATLEPQGSLELLTTIGFTAAVNPVIDGYLGDDAKARELAAKRLDKAVPYTAVVVRARIENEKDAGKRIQLRVLYYRMLQDSWEHADAIFKSAQGLNTVASNHGPFKDKWQSPEVQKLRVRGKVLHWCFIDPEYYGKSLTRDRGMYVPYRDLPAAAELYRLAAKMYASLASEETDEVRKATLTGNVASAKRAAAACADSATRTKG
jgi:hypothetical protein